MLVRDEAFVIPADQTAGICERSGLNTLETRGQLSIAGCSPKELSLSAPDTEVFAIGSCFGLRQFDFSRTNLGGPLQVVCASLAASVMVQQFRRKCKILAFTLVMPPPPLGVSRGLEWASSWISWRWRVRTYCSAVASEAPPGRCDEKSAKN